MFRQKEDNLFVMRGLDLRVEELGSLEEAQKMMATLMERNKTQGHLLVAWKRRLKEQNEMLYGLHREREEQMRMLTSQLLLLEANMRLKQQKIDSILNHRDRIISQQHETIKALEKELSAWRLNPTPLSFSTPQRRPDTLPLGEKSSSLLTGDPPVQKEEAPESTNLLLLSHDGDESLDDSDSAVVIEDGPDHSLSFIKEDEESRNPQVKVIRSISDVVAAARANRCHRDHDEANTFALRGVAENEESISDSGSVSDVSSEDSPFNKRNFLRGSFERIPVLQDFRSPLMTSPNGLSLCSRAVSNHRSVTRPRDVKCKKSKKCAWKSPPQTENT